MLQQKRSGSHLSARKSQQPQDDVAPCSSLYLYLLTEVEGVSIPPSSLQNSAQAQLHPALRLLSTLASWYLDPLSAAPVVRAGSVSEEHPVVGPATTLTPIHLTLEPLLFGVAPRSITLHLLGVLAVIMAGLGVFVRADGMDKVGEWVQEAVQDRRENEVGKGL
ncbi:hypothetical protein BCV69DRAFT_83574 [Microstroma glucosiphilum]|uniref:Uncharacterized protein n=1 Tax=Pseudomicrostroma glucosiphilum TaxID=1684307 RepID=A0A316U0J5_9BASI|nr:hypothetical protein BCV69DRAFT_83574 [Pseudomicrostroma glucosiphilum]PWN18051.1 hypothetical protein BCV69DRAFT_83574 [Pseudomicrostroma glucosiphilum]